MLECPVYKPIRDKYPSLLDRVVLGSLKSFLQLYHQVDISLYLTKTTPLHSKKNILFETIIMCFDSTSLFNFMDFGIIFISFDSRNKTN